MRVPNPAIIEVTIHRTDPVTSARYDTTSIRYGANVEIQTGDNGLMLVWDEDEDNTRGTFISEPVDMGGGVLTATAIFSNPEAADETLRIRPLDPYDAVTMAPDAGVPQPLAVVEAHIMRGGMLALQLDAVVAPDNTVVTLIIETGMGAYVRYDGEWILLPEGNTALDDMSLVQVAPSALAVWDAGDASGTTVSVADLPTKTQGEVETIEMPGEVPAPLEQETAVVAAGNSIPSVNRAEDLPIAVRYAIMHPDSRWYVVKRAHALGALDKIPQEWQLGKVAPEVLPEFPTADDGVILPFEEATAASAVVAAAKQYVQLCVNGTEPLGFFGSFIMRAREHRLLDHPAIIAAIDWRDWLHPRGKDGKFIEKFGMVNVFSDPDSLPGDRSAARRRAQVVDLTPNGAKLEYVDALGNPKAADPAAGFPEIIPTQQIVDKLSDAPRAIAILRNKKPVNTGAQETGRSLVTRGAESQDEARKILAGVEADEPVVSRLLSEISGVDGLDYDPSKIIGDNGQFYGGEFRLKTEGSLVRKIASKGAKLPGGPEQAAGEIGDALRYTLHYDPENFGANAQRVINELRAKGYDVDVSNSWNNEGRAYKGINADITGPDGHRFELQFHTPESQRAKDRQHLLYERQRKLVKHSPPWEELERQMFEISKPLERPADVGNVAAVMRG